MSIMIISMTKIGVRVKTETIWVSSGIIYYTLAFKSFNPCNACQTNIQNSIAFSHY